MQYTVKTPVVGDVPNFFELLSSDAKQLQVELLKACVCVDGVPIGEEGLSQIPISEVIKLTSQVMKAAGFGVSEEDAKK